MDFKSIIIRSDFFASKGKVLNKRKVIDNLTFLKKVIVNLTFL